MKIHPFWASCEKIRPLSTELPRDFCAGIGPLQLGVVLVLISIWKAATVLCYPYPIIQSRTDMYVMTVSVVFS